MIAEKNKQFGFINIYCGKTSTLSSCCRLRSDTNNEYFNAFGAGSSKIGSLGVVTTNLPRLAIRSKTKEKFMENLKELVTNVARINNAKRHIIRKRIEVGASPLYSLGFMSLSKQYSTFGITGLNEAVELLGYDILKQDGQQFVIDMLEVINKTNDRMQKQYEAPHNCEQTPAENSGIKLSKKDNYLKYTKDSLFYSNQFVPLIQEADMLDRIKLQGLFDSHFSGGAILHVNIEEQITDTQKIIDLINTCAKMGVVYWAINYNLQMCEADHMTIGANGKCPMCGEPIKENFTRVVGFLTNIKNWNVVRRERDYPNRQFYKEI
jgi:ribonucleoside-triphosphate reductase